MFLVPEHLEVEIAEYKDSGGIRRRVRMTGNTRAMEMRFVGSSSGNSPGSALSDGQ
jgi:hypothetical protein